MKPKLISFKHCPFVQKAVLALLSKKIDFDVEYIDMQNPPDWFMKISPLGKVPVLLIGDEVLFESSVIVEYLDEVHEPMLHPDDPLVKARNRAWMEFGNECLMNMFNLVMAADEAGFNEQRDGLNNKLDQLNAKLDKAPYFNGDKLSLVDISFIPLFQRMNYLDEVVPGLVDAERHPRVKAWADELLKLDIVGRSTVPEIRELYLTLTRKRGGHIVSLMD
jgi:glutathione S-transferase